mgnify:FL=1|jgi:hypothetical protein
MAQAINSAARATRQKKKTAEAFENGAEKHTIDAVEYTRTLPAKARAIQRRKGTKSTIYTLRGTEQQKRLVAFAAEQEGVSIQKIYSQIFDILEEKYGAEVPLDPSL